MGSISAVTSSPETDIDPAIQATHQCTHSAVPVDGQGCIKLSSVHFRNNKCCLVKCKSPWRVCKTCVTASFDEKSDGPVDPESGLCEKHGGVILVAKKAKAKHAEIGDRVISIDPDDISPFPNQPRKEFDREKLQALADSIKESGQLVPGLVKLTPNGPKKI